MALLDRLRSNGNGAASKYEGHIGKLTEALQASEGSRLLEAEGFRESLAELEIALEDVGWQRLTLGSDTEFTREGLSRIIDLARVNYLKNPLIRRAIMVQSYYVFGQGLEIKARDERINEVVQEFWTDMRNRDVLTGHAAREANEQTLQHDGNLFFPLFTDPSSGKVTVRMIPVEEITDIITNPEDRSEPWYYKREWMGNNLDLQTGELRYDQLDKAYYPDWRIARSGPTDAQGKRKPHPATIGDVRVEADVPIYHLRVGGLRQARFGIPDVYAALDWARAYKSFLENWSSIVASLQRFAWKLTTKGSRRAAAKTKLGTSVEADGAMGETNPAPVTGSFFISDEQTKLDPIPKSGATIAATDGRALRLMVAAATDIPDTILSGDPDMGNLATAKTLDRPTELAMRSRQMLWQECLRDILGYVVDADLRASAGRLPRVKDQTVPGGVRLKPDDNAEAGTEPDTTIDVSFPPILEQDRLSVVQAIATAFTLDGKTSANILPENLIAKLLLMALEVENVDELVTELFPDGGANGQTPDQEVAAEREAMASALRDLKEAIADAAQEAS